MSHSLSWFALAVVSLIVSGRCVRHHARVIRGSERISTLCAVTANHLDEQYGSLENLVQKTCLSEESMPATPDLVVVMTQELNGAKLVGTGEHRFPKFVHERSLPGYRLAGMCAPPLSANSALYVRSAPFEEEVFADELECVGKVTEPCDWSNCKGSSIMSVPTSFGTLVVANWHGSRWGDDRIATYSQKRVKEFKRAVVAIANRIIPRGLPRFVVFGGDTNIYSDLQMVLETSDNGTEAEIDWKKVQTPQEYWRLTAGDILGVPGITVGDHLAGDGVDSDTSAILAQLRLKQVKGWDTICPTKTKTPHEFGVVKDKLRDRMRQAAALVTGRKVKKKEVRRPSFACVTPADQMSDGKQSLEYLDTTKLTGVAGKAPSLTERIFLSENLYDGCGKVIKDVRNKQDDHDPVFVHCSLPHAN